MEEKIEYWKSLQRKLRTEILMKLKNKYNGSGKVVVRKGDFEMYKGVVLGDYRI